MKLKLFLELKEQLLSFQQKAVANLVVCDRNDCSHIKNQRNVDIVVGRFEAKNYYYSPSVQNRAKKIEPVFVDYI